MLKGQNIICFSCDWNQDPLSKHHIMSRLAKDNRVLWINSIGMRKPTVSHKDFSRAFSKLKAFINSLQCVKENLFVFSPLVIPFHGIRWINWLNRQLLLAQNKILSKKTWLRPSYPLDLPA